MSGLLLELIQLGAGEDLDALLLEGFAGESRDLRILRRQDLRQYLDDGDVRSERAVERRELDADRAGPDHQQRFRHPVGDHRLEVSPNQFLVWFDPRQYARPRASRDDDVLCLIAARPERTLRAFGSRRLHGDLAGCIDRRVTPDHRNFVLLHQKADAVVEALGDCARALHDGCRIV